MLSLTFAEHNINTTKLMLTIAPTADADSGVFCAQIGATAAPETRIKFAINALNLQGEFLFWGNFYFPPI
jgi:hypothetical protein